MLHVFTNTMLAGAFVLGGLLLGGRDRRHGREVAVMLMVCIVCTIAGVVGVMV